MSVISCGQKEVSAKSLYDRINGQNITVSDNNFWGDINKNSTKLILSQLANKLNLTNKEKALIQLNPNLTRLNPISKSQSEEMQYIHIIVIGSPWRSAKISIKWQLTKSQINIYPIYKSWPAAYVNYNNSAIEYPWINTLYAKGWDSAKSKWDPRGDTVNINNKLIKNQVINSLSKIWNFSSLSSYPLLNYLSIPNQDITVNKPIYIKNIQITSKDGKSTFPLLQYDDINQQPQNAKGMYFNYVNDRYILSEILQATWG